MTDTPRYSRPKAFLMVFLVFFVVSLLFQVAMAPSAPSGTGALWQGILSYFRSSLGVALIAAGVVVLVRRDSNDDGDDD